MTDFTRLVRGVPLSTSLLLALMVMMTQITTAVPIEVAAGVSVYSYTDETGTHQVVHHLSPEEVHQVFQRNQQLFFQPFQPFQPFIPHYFHRFPFFGHY